MKRNKNLLPTFVIAALAVGWTQTTELAPVVSKPISRTVELPGEFQPFQSVSIHAKLRGYVDRVLVDRGSAVKATVRAQKDLEAYLQITAPFDGVVTDRLVHRGALVGPGGDPVLLVIQ